MITHTPGSTPNSKLGKPNTTGVDRAADEAPYGSAQPVRKGGRHRVPEPPHSIKGRAAVVAVAAGAVVTAGHSALTSSHDKSTPAVAADTEQAQARLVAATAMPQAAQFLGTPSRDQQPASALAVSASSPDGPQVLEVPDPTIAKSLVRQLAAGQEFAHQLEVKAAAMRRPLFVLPARGIFTSGFGSRWGTLHGGVDIANAIGTPILAATDGTVIDAGPASGFGMWVRVRADDGTVTVYGHIDSATVKVGQHVMAGDQIARMGNRGFSTGPHCHFEVWLHGTDRIDPLGWLASRGISLGPEHD